MITWVRPLPWFLTRGRTHLQDIQTINLIIKRQRIPHICADEIQKENLVHLVVSWGFPDCPRKSNLQLSGPVQAWQAISLSTFMIKGTLTLGTHAQACLWQLHTQCMNYMYRHRAQCGHLQVQAILKIEPKKVIQQYFMWLISTLQPCVNNSQLTTVSLVCCK